MSVDLLATIGGPDSNSYQDTDGVQVILDGVPNTGAWDALEGDTQDVAAVHATTLLEAIAYQGQKSTIAQALSWPRQCIEDPDFGDIDDSGDGVSQSPGVYLDSATMPRRLLRAHALLCLEIARAGTSDVWGVDESLSIVRTQIDVIAIEYADPSKRRIGLRRFPTVWTALFPLTRAAKPQSVERA